MRRIPKWRPRRKTSLLGVLSSFAVWLVVLVAVIIMAPVNAIPAAYSGKKEGLASRRVSVAGSGSLVFSSVEAHGFSAIFEINGDGTGLTRLTTGPQDYRPEWSPDGTKIAFLRVNAPARGQDLLVMTNDARDVKVVASDVVGFSWAPDSKRLAITDSAGLKIVAAGGGGLRLIAQRGSGDAFTPLWSPDATRIAYEVEYIAGLGVVSSAGGAVHGLPATSAAASCAASRDARQLAFARDGNSRPEREPGVFVVDDNGENLARLAAMPVDSELDWSRDGTKLTFTGPVLRGR